MINRGGIAIGMTAFFMFSLYLMDEMSYDRFHEKGDRIVRLVHHAAWDGGEAHHAVTSPAFAPALKATFPEIEEASLELQIKAQDDAVVKSEKKFKDLQDEKADLEKKLQKNAEDIENQQKQIENQRQALEGLKGKRKVVM